MLFPELRRLLFQSNTHESDFFQIFCTSTHFKRHFVGLFMKKLIKCWSFFRECINWKNNLDFIKTNMRNIFQKPKLVAYLLDGYVYLWVLIMQYTARGIFMALSNIYDRAFFMQPFWLLPLFSVSTELATKNFRSFNFLLREQKCTFIGSFSLGWKDNFPWNSHKIF